MSHYTTVNRNTFHCSTSRTSSRLDHFCAASLIGSSRMPKWYNAVELSPNSDLLVGMRKSGLLGLRQ